jgi:hypothetical protein
MEQARKTACDRPLAQAGSSSVFHRLIAKRISLAL